MQNNVKKLPILIVAFFITYLISCGGGGGGGSDSSTSDTNSIVSGQVVVNQAVSNQQLFMDSDGNGVAIWSADNSSGNSSIWSSTYDSVNETWSDAIEIANYNRDILFFNAAANHLGEVHVVWTQFDADLQYGILFDGILNDQIWGAYFVPTTGWSSAALVHDPEPLDAHTYILSPPIVDVNINGRAMMAWKQVNDSHLVSSDNSLHTMRFERASGWVDDQYIAEINDVLFDDIALSLNDNGNATMVWAQSSSTNNFLLSRQYTDALGWDLIEFPPQVIENDASSDINNFLAIKVKKLANDDAIVFWSYYSQSTATRISTGRNYDSTSDTWDLPYQFNPDMTLYQSSSLTLNNLGDGFFLWGELVPALGGRVLSSNQFTLVDGWNSGRIITEDQEVISLDRSAIDLDNFGNGIALWVGENQGDTKALKSRHYHPINGWDDSVQLIDNDIASSITLKMIPDNSGDAMALYLRDSLGTNPILTSKIIFNTN